MSLLLFGLRISIVIYCLNEKKAQQYDSLKSKIAAISYIQAYLFYSVNARIKYFILELYVYKITDTSLQSIQLRSYLLSLRQVAALRYISMGNYAFLPA